MSERTNQETLRARKQYWLDNRWWYLLILVLVGITSWLADFKSLFPNEPPTQPVIFYQPDQSVTTNTTVVTPEVTKRDAARPPEQPTVSSMYAVSGYVYDADQQPLGDVKINVPGLTGKVTTNDDGLFEGNFKTPPAHNSYTITFYKSGYAPMSLHYFELPKLNIEVYLKKIEP